MVELNASGHLRIIVSIEYLPPQSRFVLVQVTDGIEIDNLPTVALLSLVAPRTSISRNFTRRILKRFR